ncbi:MAG TPA: CYTH domain-containing protein [Micavibrio sp.]|nr:CYTH domain-containing protein [Micavibrio sp.]
MAQEIEYRFLLTALPDFPGLAPTPITQGYLSTDPDKTVRIRRIGNEARITVKGRKIGAVAPEFEYGIPVEDAVEMLKLCGAGNTLDKDRYHYKDSDGHVWEVDRFKGRHEGLVIAEIEVPSLKVSFEKPHWLNGVDITTDARFANAALTQTTHQQMLANIASVLKP